MTLELNILQRKVSLDLAYWLVLVFFVLAISGTDYSPVVDTFRDGKMRWLLFACVPVLFTEIARDSVYLALFCSYALFMWTVRDYPFYGVTDILGIFACTFLAIDLKKRFSVQTIIDCIGWCAFANAVIGVGQILGGVFPIAYGKESWFVPIGMLGNPTILGPLLGLGIYWALCKRGWYLVSIPLFLFVLYKCDSAMSIFATGSGVGYWCFRRWPLRSMLAGFLAAAATFAMVRLTGTEFFNFNGRFFIWPYGWKFFLNNIYVGNGPGSWSGLYSTLEIPFKHKWDKLHNDLLQGLAEYGLLGMAIFTAAAGQALKRHMAAREEAIGFLVIIVANSFGNFPFHIITYGLIAAWCSVVMEDAAWNSKSLPNTYSSVLWGASGPTGSTFWRNFRNRWSSLT